MEMLAYRVLQTGFMVGYIEFVPESIGMSEIMFMAGINYPSNFLGTSRVTDPKAL